MRKTECGVILNIQLKVCRGSRQVIIFCFTHRGRLWREDSLWSLVGKFPLGLMGAPLLFPPCAGNLRGNTRGYYYQVTINPPGIDICVNFILLTGSAHLCAAVLHLLQLLRLDQLAAHHPGESHPVPSVRHAGGSPPLGTSDTGSALPLWAPLLLIVAITPDFLLFSTQW